MYDAGKIITGLIIGLAFLTFPIWYNLGSAMPPAPDPKLSPKALAAK
ncbi:MAG: cytochrome C, partial [Deltaproteobacteria bacterium]|nr:cytochrome C [Deltaproteobacteria bacterium]